MVRRIPSHDVPAERLFEFITNALWSSPPGMPAQVLLHSMDGSEMSTGEVKHKLGEKKSWPIRAMAKNIQMPFICLSVPLLKLIEPALGNQGIRNTPEEKRRMRCAWKRRARPQPRPNRCA